MSTTIELDNCQDCPFITEQKCGLDPQLRKTPKILRGFKQSPPPEWCAIRKAGKLHVTLTIMVEQPQPADSIRPDRNRPHPVCGKRATFSDGLTVTCVKATGHEGRHGTDSGFEWVEK